MLMSPRYRRAKRILSNFSSGLIDIEQCKSLYNVIESLLSHQQVIVERKPVHFKKLIYSKESIQRPVTSREIWKIIFLIIRTRGLIRWLSFNLLSSHIVQLEGSYFLSRLSLFRLLLKNKTIVVEQIQKHLQWVSEVKNPTKILTVTQNDYFSAISGVKMSLPTLSILSVQGNFRPEPQEKVMVSDLIPQLMHLNARALLQLLLEFGISQNASEYMERNYPDAKAFLDSQIPLSTFRMGNADRTFDEIAGSPPNLKSDLLEDIEIWHQRFLIKHQILFEFDAAGSHRLPFVAGHWQYTMRSKMDQNKVFINEPITQEEHIPEAIFLSGRADENWFHLLLDTLPRYLFFDKLPAHLPVLIREDLPPTTKEFIRQIIKRPLIELQSNSRRSVGKLHLIAARSTCYDSISTDVIEQVSFSPQTIRLLADWIMGSTEIRTLFKVSNYAYFRRSSRQRRILNDNQIEKVVTDKALQIVDDNSDLYRNQVSLFSTLKIAVVPGGAMLANMIFMKPNSTILCLRSSRRNDLELWKKLARAVQVNYYEVTGPPSYFGRNQLQRDHSNYLIFYRKFRRILSDVIQSTT